MMQDNANKKSESLVIGSKFPIDMKAADFNTSTFQLMGNESAALIWRIKSPTALELADFNYGRIKFGVYRHGKVMFFCVDQQPFAEGDSSYHAQFYNFPPDMHMMKAATDIGLPVYMCVVDQNNILRALRCVNLNKAMTDFIAETFEYQRTDEGHVAYEEYEKTVRDAYKKFPEAKDMMNAANVTCEIKSKRNN